MARTNWLQSITVAIILTFTLSSYAENVQSQSADNFIYTKTLTSSDLPLGIIGLSVPTTAPSLYLPTPFTLR